MKGQLVEGEDSKGDDCTRDSERRGRAGGRLEEGRRAG